MSTRRSSASTSARSSSNEAADNRRNSLCSFTFSDARRCRNPLQSTHPYLCPFHARKHLQDSAAEEFAKDISYFLSAQYLSACDLTTALGHLFAAVAQGTVKPKTAATLAYLAQTMSQTIQIAEDEYTNAFGTDDWRKAIRSSVTANREYLDPDSPPASTPTPTATVAPQNAFSTRTQGAPPKTD
jgi:hypothetical protein